MILVVVLGLLTMMALALLTYVLVAAQAKRTARAAAHVERRGDPPQALLHQAALQVIRGTNEPTSVLQTHSLLEDMYGNDGVRGQIPFVDPAFGTDAFNGFAPTTVTVPNGGTNLTFPTILKAGTFLQIVVTPYGPDLIPLGRAGIDDDGDGTVDEPDEFGLGDDSRLADTDNFYNGRLFTMIDGPAAGQSTRIVGYTVNTASTPPIAVFTLLPFDSMQAASATAWSTRGAPRPGDRFVINGMPFNGTGFGLDPNTYAASKLLNASGPNGRQFALMPNPAFMARTGPAYENAGYTNWQHHSIFDPAGPGGADEDYDAPDYQNMLLGMRTLPAGGANFPANGILPSLHRPDLINYWINQAGSNGTWDHSTPPSPVPADLRRRVSLRPDIAHHRNFTGSNPNYDPRFGPWDVDNDGDGVADSIWVDLGLPIQTAPNGTRYKPMFAVMCLDMDGKLNLNAHGNVTQLAYDTANPNFNPLGQSVASFGATTVLGPYAGGLANTATPLPVGLGYGPAEINLSRLFTNSLGVPTGEYSRILGVDSAAPLPGRYGEFGRSFSVLPAGFPRVPGPGLTFFDGLAFDPTMQFNPDWESLLQHYDLPGLSLLSLNAASANLQPYHNPEYALFATPGAYGTPPDINGNGALGLDLRGLPYWGLPAPTDYRERTGLNEFADRATNPYKINLSWQARERTYASAAGMVPVDAPFTPEELERLLRTNDLDASMLPDRLLQLAPQSFVTDTNAARRRNAVTTESWDLPTPNMAAMPNDLIDDLFDTATGVVSSGRGLGVVEILRERLRNAGINVNNLANFNAVVRAYLPPEVIAGQRLDLNRPLGNGIDDNGNLIVDEPQEATAEGYATSIFPGASTNFDLSNDGVINANDELARQALAKQLYCLVWMLIDDQYLVRLQNASGLAPAEARQELARQIAQWAVNVVDFRDRDSIMTPFEYDVNPFTDDTGAGTNPWNVDGVITAGSADNALAYRGLVWGTERPELLLTESLAFHDTRTENLDNDAGGDGVYDASGDPDTDDDFDQRFQPRGSLYVEIYNPGNPWDAPPAELYGGPAVDRGIDLDRMAGTSPVWRLMIAKPTASGHKDPDDPFDPLPSTDAERAVYFTTTEPTSISDVTTRYYTSQAVASELLPGRYAVIGSAASSDVTSSTNVGRRTGPDYPRNIQLRPDVSITDGTGTNVYPSTTNEIQVPLGVAINQPSSLNISEPLAGYPPADVAPNQYSVPYDEPLDITVGYDPLLQSYGTHESFRMIHLQRLANPTLAWNPESGKAGHNPAIPVNPYLTVDSLPVDLTVYNGDENGYMGMDEPRFTAAPPGSMKFNSRQRNGGASYNIWAQTSDAPSVATEINPLTNSTLGYLNESFGMAWNTTNAPNLSGTKSDGSPITAADYRGTPMTPFPWFTWLNRPFVNQYEILQVPAERSSKLLAAHTLRQAGDDPYQPDDDNTAAPWYQNYPYRHLPNFFYTVDALATEPAAHLYRLFEYVHVPSPFAGTEDFLNPLTMAIPPVAGEPALPFHPPYNRVSRYREPGKVNLNTIGDQEVWRALTADHPGMPNFDQLVDSRRGYPDTSGDMVAQNNASPTFFANPFRSFAGNDLVPLDTLRQPIGFTRRDIETTLLRSKRDASGQPTNDPLFAADSASLATNTTQNPYFRYLGLQKLGNKVTTRSNVYGVWITVGYFEVDDTAMSSLNGRPDGIQIGAELGSDTGNIQRHRAFYLIDRSIPVAFERGHDHNVENCILIKRFIE
ncbi:MAG: hypothetical protein KF708_22720 [Pirellulales bacterium]|nr:hypothetical protein [Pirellulales bacterium]